MTINEMKEKKKEKGYSYAKIAELSGVPLGTVQKIFSGETESPRYDTLTALEQVFNEQLEVRESGGQIFDEDYFEHLIAEIQEIRASERRFYQKITDIYATAVDYDKNSVVTKEFYATVQNKMHYAVHGNTAAEVIAARADHNKEHMGLTSWKTGRLSWMHFLDLMMPMCCKIKER